MFGLNLWSSKPPFFNAGAAGRPGNLLFQSAAQMAASSSPQTSHPSTNRETDSPHSSPLDASSQQQQTNQASQLAALFPGAAAAGGSSNPILQLYAQLAQNAQQQQQQQQQNSSAGAEALLRAVANQQQQQQQQQQLAQGASSAAAALLQHANPAMALALLQAAQSAQSGGDHRSKSPAQGQAFNLQLTEATLRHQQLLQQQQQQNGAAIKLLLNSLEQQGGTNLAPLMAMLGQVVGSPRADADHVSPASSSNQPSQQNRSSSHHHHGRHHQSSTSTVAAEQQQQSQGPINLSTTRGSPPNAHSTTAASLLRSHRVDSLSDSGSNHGASLSEANGGSSRKRSWKVSVGDDLLTCKVCGERLAPRDIEQHWLVERERIIKRQRGSDGSPKASDEGRHQPLATATNKQQAGNGSRNNTEADLSRNRYETYQKIQHNRETRLQRCVMSATRAHSSAASLVGSDFLCPYCECKVAGLQMFFQHLPNCDQFPILRIVANSAKQSVAAAEAVAGIANKLPAAFAQNAMPAILRNVFGSAAAGGERVWPGIAMSPQFPHQQAIEAVLQQQQQQQQQAHNHSRPTSSASDNNNNIKADNEQQSPNNNNDDTTTSNNLINNLNSNTPAHAASNDNADESAIDADDQLNTNNTSTPSPQHPQQVVMPCRSPIEPISPSSSPKNLVIY